MGGGLLYDEAERNLPAHTYTLTYAALPKYCWPATVQEKNPQPSNLDFEPKVWDMKEKT